MASNAVMTAVAARVAANWSYTPIYTDNVEGSITVDGSAFMALEYPVSDETQLSFGAPGFNAYRETGAFRISLCIPIGSGLSPWAGYIDTLRTAFRGVTFSGVTTFEAPPPLINDASWRGAYFEISFVVEYRFDIVQSGQAMI